MERIDIDHFDETKEEDRAEFKLTAEVAKVNRNRLVAAGVTIVTVRADKPEKPLETNALIKVEGLILENALIARKIEVFEQADRDKVFEIRGKLQTLYNETFVVSGLTIRAAKIKTDLTPGSRVHVSGRIVDGEFVAQSIEALGNPGKGGGD